MADPAHTADAPEIAGGAAVIVTIVVAMQPVHEANDIVAVPAAMPVMTAAPVEIVLTVATDVLPLLHVPQPEATDRVDVRPTHAGLIPVIAGVLPTVTIVVAIAVPQLLLTL
jgi:hypothetical protein